MKNNKAFLLSAFFCTTLFICSVLLIYRMHTEYKAEAAEAKSVQLHAENRETAEGNKILIERVTLGAIGDILIHDWVYNDAKTKTAYDFKPMFEHAKSLLSTPDLLLANQETILGGHEIGISSYPMFNSPQEVGNALIDAGVDIVSTANNHSLDKGVKGLGASLDYMDQIGLPHVGTSRTPSEQQTLKILGKNGIKVAYLSYTYGTNGIPVPSGKDYLVNLIDETAMKKEIKRAKDGADVVVMSMHWGDEYQLQPTEEQKRLAETLVNEGVDIIFGHHPHVLQPMEWIDRKDGGRSLVVYSLGNFLSGQMRDYKDIGGLATVEVTKYIDQNGVDIKLSDPGFVPTYVSNKQLKNYRIVPLEDAASFGLPHAKSKFAEIMKHMMGNVQ
ncbi:CapA family protein [Cytobacillus firmus]|uniref:CapA family protein n=1 Tax=Cytobacillus firmus TaxID=1399 RepID=UPI001580B7FE|nr:CapA family protein [Cytobacillus firmus]MBG9550511.1 capsular biosynthesis protein [Cytobacillus firmus]MBG9602426.1 capsular biosynthesis protein [Cytobacillus firmus]MBG9657379.1 capsular biosynthesis protein [Cytobacillus firmus]MED1905195.1 CapA family protein [Cytobacillus firmus]MED1939950.1 CapA family protein [Cytobacillus firmus]